MDTQETKIYTAILITSVILGIIILFFVISLIRHQRRNQALYQSKIRAEITTLERERTRIASDLHDELGPLLSAAKLRINILEVQTEEDFEHLARINKNIDDIMHRMREISNDLMPQALLSRSLFIAINDFLQNLESSSGISISFSYQDFPDISSDRTINFYRIVQEIVHNTVKHAKATELKIDFSMKNGKYIIHTKDNGKGFNYNRLDPGRMGIGLRSLLSRTEIMGGQMYIDSGAGGTEYNIEIPA